MSDNLLGLRENPFAAGHDPRLVHEHEQRSEVVAGFRQALAAGEPFILVTGEAGVGKTSIVTQVLSDEKAWSAFITNPLLTRAELLEEICLRFGVDLPESVSKPRLLAELERHLAEIRREDGAPVLVVDEAHDLSLELLEELRLLSNLEFKGRPLVQIVLVGLAALEARMSEPDLAQLRQRIATHLRVRPLGGEDTWRYIHQRVAAAGGDGAERFPDETCIEIHKLTRGVPRSINTLAAQALLAASREAERTVTVAHVRASAAGTWLRANQAPASAAGLPGIPGAPATKPSGERPRPKPGAPPVAAEKASPSSRISSKGPPDREGSDAAGRGAAERDSGARAREGTQAGQDHSHQVRYRVTHQVRLHSEG
jgi:general secretion pathway protein A